jgi:hypothetical protein
MPVSLVSEAADESPDESAPVVDDVVTTDSESFTEHVTIGCFLEMKSGVIQIKDIHFSNIITRYKA